MRNRSLRIFLLGALSLHLAGCDRLFGPSDYDACVLQSMEGVNNNFAAALIANSCQKKFPKKKALDSELGAAALSKLNGHGGIGYSGAFSGNIYNGNNDWTITQVTIVLTPKGKENDAKTFLDTKEYNADVTAAPLTSSRLYFSVDDPSSQEYSWNIVKARGFQAH